MVHLLAFSLQDQVEKYGAYIGIAAFFGLAVLTILYFAQARELRRLRDWAGRAPERAQEVEARAVAQAEAARRVQSMPQRTPPPKPATTAGRGGGRRGHGPRGRRGAPGRVGLGHHAGLHLLCALGRTPRPIAQALELACLREVEQGQHGQAEERRNANVGAVLLDLVLQRER